MKRTRAKSCSYETSVVVPERVHCGLATLCDQASSSLAGTVIVGSFAPGTIRIEWSSSTEHDAISGYRLTRHDCGDAETCGTEVATVGATGSCGTAQLHSLTDTPPFGLWTYRLEVLDASGAPVCAADRVIDTTYAH